MMKNLLLTGLFKLLMVPVGELMVSWKLKKLLKEPELVVYTMMLDSLDIIKIYDIFYYLIKIYTKYYIKKIQKKKVYNKNIYQ